jgi:nicotinamide/nicotinate riboside kinase
LIQNDFIIFSKIFFGFFKQKSTNGGKTTLTKQLKKEFENSFMITQDDYYRPKDSAHLQFISSIGSLNFDVITAIDMERMRADINELKAYNKYDYIFIEGFVIYDDEELYNILDRRYFLTLNKEECLRRRQSRHYTSIDMPHYFDDCVWPEFQKYKMRCEQKYKNIKYIMGTDSVLSIFKTVFDDLNKL